MWNDVRILVTSGDVWPMAMRERKAAKRLTFPFADNKLEMRWWFQPESPGAAALLSADNAREMRRGVTIDVGLSVKLSNAIGSGSGDVVSSNFCISTTSTRDGVKMGRLLFWAKRLIVKMRSLAASLCRRRSIDCCVGGTDDDCTLLVKSRRSHKCTCCKISSRVVILVRRANNELMKKFDEVALFDEVVVASDGGDSV